MDGDWDIYFKNRTKFFAHKPKNLSFTILHTPEDCTRIDSSADHVVIVPTEDFAIFTDLEKACGRPLRDVLILSNTVRIDTEFDFDNPNFRWAGDWHKTPVHTKDQTINTKKYLFDFLFGHRENATDYLFEKMQGHLDKCIYSYNHQHTPGIMDMETELTKLLHRNQNVDYSIFMNTSKELSDTNNKLYQVTNNDHFDPFIDDNTWAEQIGEEQTIIPKYTSRITPVKMYEQSLASCIRESGWTWVVGLQLTEKTMKPIQCKRLLFMLGCQHANRVFERIGFKTYGEYPWDDIADWKKRADAYVDYVGSLTMDTLLEMYQTEADTIAHNYSFANKPWTAENLIWLLSKI